MKNFRLNVLIRVIIIALIITALVYYLLVATNYLRSVYLVVFFVLSIIEFIWYVDRTNRDFKAFLLALLQDDFTTTFPEKAKGRSFNELYKVFNQITRKFKQLGSEKEAQHIFLEALIAHVNVGILSFDENEKIQLVNDATKDLLNLRHLVRLDNIGRVDGALLENIRQVRAGENKLVKIVSGHRVRQINLHASEFKLQGKYYKLVSLQNIKNELDANELAAWQKLIRVLTHEIMNSVTPITSLTSTLKQIVEKSRNEAEPIPPATVEKLWTGLDAVENRGVGLQTFIQAYRKLTKLPTPKFEQVNVKKQVERVLALLDPEAIEVSLNIPGENHILADPDLLDQVLINLIKNAREAMVNTHSPKLSIGHSHEKGITISDNGEGISPGKFDQVFVPFFTTKKEGTGIGLALARQIMQLHSGKIELSSKPGQGTTFRLIF